VVLLFDLQGVIASNFMQQNRMQETSHPNKHLAKQIHLGKGDFMQKSII